MPTRIHIVHVDNLGARVAPKPEDPVTESAMVEIVRFLGRAAIAAGRAVGQQEPVVRLIWRWGQIDVKPAGESGFIGVIVLETPEAPPATHGQTAKAVA